MSLGQFKGKFGQGIRPNLYTVTSSGGFDLTEDEALLIKAAAMPSASLGVVTIPFKGREVKRAGDRTFTDWTISVLCDDANAIHEKFIQWSQGFMGLADTTRGLNYENIMRNRLFKVPDVKTTVFEPFLNDLVP